MTDNVRFKINSYLQILKYIDDSSLRNEIVESVCVLLTSIPNTQHGKKSSDKLEACCDKINELFANTNLINALDAMNILEGCGFSLPTIKRAKKNLGVKSTKQTYQGQWCWYMGDNNE